MKSVCELGQKILPVWEVFFACGSVIQNFILTTKYALQSYLHDNMCCFYL